MAVAAAQGAPRRPPDAGVGLGRQYARLPGTRPLGVWRTALGCGEPRGRPSCPTGVLGSPLISLLFWILICFSIAALFTKRYSIRPLIVALLLRSIYYLGIGPTLNILGTLNVSGGSPPGSSEPRVTPKLLVDHSWGQPRLQVGRWEPQGCCGHRAAPHHPEAWDMGAVQIWG